jgi:hypothetical protein
MSSRGVPPQSRSTYRIATTEYVANEEPERIGRGGETRSLGLLRDALVAHARTNGFARDT